MKRRYVILTALLTAMLSPLLTSLNASAQGPMARAYVHFSFAANHRVLPAGCYKLALNSHNYMVLVNCETAQVAGLMVRTTPAEGPRVEKSSLVFNVVRGAARLVQVRFAQTNTESELAVQPRPQRELAQNSSAEVVTVEAE